LSNAPFFRATLQEKQEGGENQVYTGFASLNMHTPIAENNNIGILFFPQNIFIFSVYHRKNKKITRKYHQQTKFIGQYNRRAKYRCC
jgi:hypothetical protein